MVCVSELIGGPWAVRYVLEASCRLGDSPRSHGEFPAGFFWRQSGPWILCGSYLRDVSIGALSGGENFCFVIAIASILRTTHNYTNNLHSPQEEAFESKAAMI